MTTKSLMQNLLEKTVNFQEWLDGLKDQKGRARILSRLVAAENGNFGDCSFVGDGVSEMRIHFGPGYRVYFARRAMQIYLLLGGGDKGSQERDIQRAKLIWKEWLQEYQND